MRPTEKLGEVKLAKMTNEHVDQLRFIFRTVMARIDFVPKATESKNEKIEPTFQEAIIEFKVDSGIAFPDAPSESF